MTPRERLDAALDKPPTAEDIDNAVKCIKSVEQLVKKAIRARVAQMNPPPMTGPEVSQFAFEVSCLIYHAQWMARKLRETIK